VNEEEVDRVLADIDQDIVEWYGSDDSATWTADGTHEPEQLQGDYYIYDRYVAPRRTTPNLLGAHERMQEEWRRRELQHFSLQGPQRQRPWLMLRVQRVEQRSSHVVELTVYDECFAIEVSDQMLVEIQADLLPTLLGGYIERLLVNLSNSHSRGGTLAHGLRWELARVLPWYRAYLEVSTGRPWPTGIVWSDQNSNPLEDLNFMALRMQHWGNPHSQYNAEVLVDEAGFVYLFRLVQASQRPRMRGQDLTYVVLDEIHQFDTARREEITGIEMDPDTASRIRSMFGLSEEPEPTIPPLEEAPDPRPHRRGVEAQQSTYGPPARGRRRSH
jgi:hypothetical protein